MNPQQSFPRVSPDIIHFGWGWMAFGVFCWGVALAYYYMSFGRKGRNDRTERLRVAHIARMEDLRKVEAQRQLETAVKMARMACDEAIAAEAEMRQAPDAAARQAAAARVAAAAVRSRDSALAASATAKALLPWGKQQQLARKNEKVSTAADAYATEAAAAAERVALISS